MPKHKARFGPASSPTATGASVVVKRSGATPAGTPSWLAGKPTMAKEAKAPPQARSYLVRQFWSILRLGELLHQAGVKKKFKGCRRCR